MSKERFYFIYGLIDPRTHMIRYVGLSSLDRRPSDHRSTALLKNDNSHRSNWIRELDSIDLDYEICLLEICASRSQLNLAEIWWIAYGRACGWPLTNLTDGGDGGALGRKHTEETKAKLKLARVGGTPALGHKHTEESKAKMRLASAARVNKAPASKENIHAKIIRDLLEKP